MARRHPLALAVVLATAGLYSSTAVAADLNWAPCGDNIDYACARLQVPLDRTGAVPGTIGLAVRRHRAAVGDERTAVVALAGGPGQESIQLATTFASLITPAIGSRDLIVFDQRGIGFSGALTCKAPPTIRDPDNPPPSLADACGRQIGAGRGHYATEDTARDLEGLRVGGGYDRLLLYATSYGTAVALAYVREHPDRVEGMVLDSPVPADGLDPFDRSTYAAERRIVAGLCARRACSRITPDVMGDLAWATSRTRTRPLAGGIYDGAGHRHLQRITQRDLSDVIAAGDLDPTLRATLPAALRAARRGDTAPLARLRYRALGAPTPRGEPFDGSAFATLCEDVAFPWDRAAPAATRIEQLNAAARALPASTFAPFDAATALSTSSASLCSGWPYLPGSSPLPGGPIPAVPTLILSGSADVRTPVESARELAGRIAGSHLLVVPGVGHSVLGTDLGGCGLDALKAFLATKPVRTCTGLQDLPIPPTLVPPRALAWLRPAHGYAPAVGRTVAAVRRTLGDVAVEVASIAVFSGGNPLGMRFGGLRGGWGQITGRGVVLHSYSYVPGVTLTGRFMHAGDTLRIGGGKANGVLRAAGAASRLGGTLDGGSVHFGYRFVLRGARR